MTTKQCKIVKSRRENTRTELDLNGRVDEELQQGNNRHIILNSHGPVDIDAFVNGPHMGPVEIDTIMSMDSTNTNSFSLGSISGQPVYGGDRDERISGDESITVMIPETFLVDDEIALAEPLHV